MGFSELKQEIEKANVADLLKAKDYINQVMNKAKENELKQVFDDDGYVYINVSRGTGRDWKKMRLYGVTRDGVIAEDINDAKAKKRTVKFDKVRTESEYKKLQN